MSAAVDFGLRERDQASPEVKLIEAAKRRKE